MATGWATSAEDRDWRRQDGAMLTFIMVLLPVLMAMAGLLLDGGMMILAKFRVQAAVEAAALAATDAYDRQVWLLEGKAVLDPDQARSLAQEFLKRNLPQGYLLKVAIEDGNRVTVEGATMVPVFFLKFFGFQDQEIVGWYKAARG